MQRDSSREEGNSLPIIHCSQFPILDFGIFPVIYWFANIKLFFLFDTLS